MPSYRQNKPEADILMNSMRSMGYTFESAIADILSKTLAIRLLEDGKRISSLLYTSHSPRDRSVSRMPSYA